MRMEMKTAVGRRMSKRDFTERLEAIGFFLPFAVLFVLFTVAPIVSALYLSLTNYSMLQIPVFVGLRNYLYMFTEDNVFLKAVSNTFAFAVLSGIIGYVLSFVVAWIINNMHFRTAFALAFYAPSITSGVAMSVVWLYFFSSDNYGLINNTLMRLGILHKPFLWTQDPSLILPVVAIVSIWMGMGNGFLGFLAGFQNLSKEILEAGTIDGVGNKFQELVYIVLPQMKPMLLFGAITSVVNAFSIYDVPLTMIGSPGPENAALTLVGHINDYAFTRLDFGYGSAVAVFLFLVTFVIGRVLFRVLGSGDE